MNTPWGKGLRLNNTNALDSTDRNISAPDSTNFHTQYLTVMNTSGNDHIAYCFRSISGYSKIGTYEGDGTTSGNIVYTTDDGTSTGSNGFEPSFLLIKNIDTSGNSWHIFDSARNPSNPVNLFLKPNQNAIEGSSNSVNFENNGFELLATYINTSSDTYLYMAFK